MNHFCLWGRRPGWVQIGSYEDRIITSRRQEAARLRRVASVVFAANARPLMEALQRCAVSAAEAADRRARAMRHLGATMARQPRPRVAPATFPEHMAWHIDAQRRRLHAAGL